MDLSPSFNLLKNPYFVTTISILVVAYFVIARRRNQFRSDTKTSKPTSGSETKLELPDKSGSGKEIGERYHVERKQTHTNTHVEPQIQLSTESKEELKEESHDLKEESRDPQEESHNPEEEGHDPKEESEDLKNEPEGSQEPKKDAKEGDKKQQNETSELIEDSRSGQSSSSCSSSDGESAKRGEQFSFHLESLNESLTALEQLKENNSSSDSGSDSSDEYEDDVCLVNNYCGFTETNLAGLQRAGKTSVVSKGQRAVYQNEDNLSLCYPISEKQIYLSLFSVFDGHGGKDCAAQASEIFPSVFEQKYVEKGRNRTDLRETFLEAYEATDLSLKEFQFEGCTATTAAVWTLPGTASSSTTRYLQVANIGDSSAFLLDGGKCVKLTVDHKLTLSSERERIIASGVQLNPKQTRLEGGLAVCRAFGDFECKVGNVTGMISVPDVTDPVVITENTTTLILATDGLWDIYTGEEAFRLIDKCDSAEDAVNMLIDGAVSSKKCHDNVTVIVIFF
eukprot:TRINITY_DN2904_c0_g1_i16.p1 TRINITY_DN2904_c0_g1~~TRINITY_DN2904_c0_g1_i16.p1  ORF type:complete len:535 (-),score=137.98 TRINITY_DN2904_c0_g1_i16:106-1632(-)